MKVSASGPSRVELRSLLSAPTRNASTSGSGDAVVTYTGSAGLAAIKGNPSASFFAVETYGNSRDLLVNTTDAYAGRVPIKRGTLFVVVTATGPSSIAAT